MEITKTEMRVIEQQAIAGAEDQLLELNELQLAFVGGGIADMVGC